MLISEMLPSVQSRFNIQSTAYIFRRIAFWPVFVFVGKHRSIHVAHEICHVNRFLVGQAVGLAKRHIAFDKRSGSVGAAIPAPSLNEFLPATAG